MMEACQLACLFDEDFCMTRFPRLYALLFLFAIAAVCVSSGQCQDRPNVLLIICDDLNDYIAGLDGHPQSRTPAIEKLSRQACLFTEAHCNIPICGPSRASLFSGIEKSTRPLTSGAIAPTPNSVAFCTAQSNRSPLLRQSPSTV